MNVRLPLTNGQKIRMEMGYASRRLVDSSRAVWTNDDLGSGVAIIEKN